jgi:serine/threonine-protein kinase
VVGDVAGAADDDPADPSDEALLREAARAPFRDPRALSLSGTTVGKYVVGELLGRGTMGVVYAARDPSLDRRVAIKVMATEAIGNAERRARFLREARTAAATSGPNIAGVFEVGQHEDTVFLAMELVDGPTLRAHAAHGLAIAEVIRIARGIARGLARAHAAGVIHRDLKPDNVMLDAAGEPKVLDFGLAKRIEIARDGAHDASTELQTVEGRLLGTPAYMSPEQAKGRELDARSDVFSFGVVLYELLAGKRPFAGATTIELLIAIDRDEPPPLPSTVPPPLAALVDACLAKNAADRPTSAELELRLATMRSTARRLPRAIVPVAIALALGVVAIVAVVAWPRGDAAYVEPTPVTSVPAALAAYEQGLAADDGSVLFQRALELDPDFAAAHLRLAWDGMMQEYSDASTRDHLRAAIAHEERLSPKLRAVAHALEPLAFVSPPDFRGAATRFEEIAARYPDDWRLQAYTVNSHALAGDPDPDEAWRRIFERFPDVPKLVAAAGQSKAYSGDLAGARAALDRCVERWPGSTACLDQRAALAVHSGECELLESLGRRLMLAAPGSQAGYRYLYFAVGGRASSSSVRAALAKYLHRPGWDAPPFDIAGRESDTAALEGDLATAIDRQRASIAAANPITSRVTQGYTARRLALLLVETGRAREAGEVIAAFLERSVTWQAPFFFEHDQLAQMWALAARTGARTPEETDAAIKSWIASYDAASGPNYPLPPHRWLHQHAFPALVDGSPAGATRALAALGAIAPPAYEDDQYFQLPIGAVYLRAGRAKEALPWLEQATRACRAVQFPVEYIWSWDLLGQAREVTGDASGACAAYRSVVTRWAKAADSLTVAHARERIAALACAR